MASSGRRNGSPSKRRSQSPEPENELLSTRQLEAFGRKVTATAGHLLSESGVSQQYQSAIGEISRELRRPALQRAVFSFTQTTPRDLIRSNVSVSEIQQRALSRVPDELLTQIPESQNTYSLFEGFRATIPEDDVANKDKQARRQSRGRKLLTQAEEERKGPPALAELKNEKRGLDHRLEMLGIRKNMCATEIREIDTKIANLSTMRKIVLDRLAGLEHDEIELEQDIVGVDNRLEDLQEELEHEAILARSKQEAEAALRAEAKEAAAGQDAENGEDASAEFMSQSIYQKIPAQGTPPKSGRRKRVSRRLSTPILHESLKAGSKIQEFHAHNDSITALDFDAPYGTLVTAALDDTVRVWDLNAGRCMGMLEGHLASVRCLQVEENIVATGSMDATIRLWDLNEAEYSRQQGNPTRAGVDEVDAQGNGDEDDDGLVYEDALSEPPPNNMKNCALHTLEAHVAEVTALHFHGDTLVSGSADKTLRQWDLQKGRCIQTLDVLWAAAQASSAAESAGPGGAGSWAKMGRFLDAEADFVGAVQVFDAALACGTADGMVRLWDLRSGQVHRSLVGHTGPVTSLQFDGAHLVTGSLDRSIRIWDLRTGAIFDAFAYANPVTSAMFDTRSIVAAAAEDVVKVYDKADGRHWDCGPGAVQREGGGSATRRAAVIERVRIKDGFLVEGRKDGMVGAWRC